MLRRMFVCSFLVAGLVFAADPIVGTWKMNMEKSKFSPGPAPKSSMATYTEEDGWLVLKVDGTDASGKPVTRNSKFRADGKEYPYESPYGKGTIIAKHSGRQGTATIKLDGGNTFTQKSVISADGKTRTITTSGKNDKGETMHNTVVYDRQ